MLYVLYMRYLMTEYDFSHFEPSRRLNKKYNAVIQNKQTGRVVKIPFGDSRYEQYKDSTGLGLWSHKDHGDRVRRRAYESRHGQWDASDGGDNTYYFSPAYFSWRYLW
jgi:hypothetical protein